MARFACSLWLMPSTNVSANGKNKDCLKKIFKELALDCDLQDVSLDSTTVKVHQDVGSKKKELIGKSRGGSTTKIHAVVDALGNPFKVVLSAGQFHDITAAPQLICDLKSAIVMAEVAYDSLRFREQIRAKVSTACIKPRRNRYDKLAQCFLAFIHVVCILIWLL